MTWIGFFILIPAVMLIYFKGFLFGTNISAIVVQFLAALLMIWARITFGRRSFHAAANPTDGELVTNGPYHHVRNPIYASILLFIWAGVFSHLNLLSLGLGILASLAILLRIFSEEHFLKQKYPEYEDYASKTMRLIPFIW